MVPKRDVFPTALARHIAAPAFPIPSMNAQDYTFAIENVIMNATGSTAGDAWDPSPYLNRWIPLRALGGNSIMICHNHISHSHSEDMTARNGRGQFPLIMFPRIQIAGLELWFHSRWYNGTMQLIEVDSWELCPQGQFWPKYAWCNKFHLPFDGSGSHRESRTHQRFRNNYMSGIVGNDIHPSQQQHAAAKLRADMLAWAGPADDLQWTLLHDN